MRNRGDLALLCPDLLQAVAVFQNLVREVLTSEESFVSVQIFDDSFASVTYVALKSFASFSEKYSLFVTPHIVVVFAFFWIENDSRKRFQLLSRWDEKLIANEAFRLSDTRHRQKDDEMK